MRSLPTLDALRTVTVGCRFTCALPAAMAANFLIASGHDQQRILQIVVLGAALAVAIARGTVRRAVPVLPAGAGRSCLAFLALGLVRHGGHGRAGQALAEWATFVALGLCLYVVLFIAAPMVTGGIAEFGTLNDMILRSTADSATGRLPMWTRALHLIVQHPLLGVGPVHFAHFGADLGLDRIRTTGSCKSCGWGLPALACLLALLAFGARGRMRAGAIVDAYDADDTFHAQRQATCSALIVAVTTIVVDSLFSGVLVMPQSQLALVFVSG